MLAFPAACAAGKRHPIGCAVVALVRGLLSAALGVALLLGGCANQGTPVADSALVASSGLTLPEGWSSLSLPGHAPGITVLALQRPTRVAPARYRVVVVPGSGCTGWAPVAERYFAGLLHAELLVLHKPGAVPGAGLGANCSRSFQMTDALPHWREAAMAALAAHPWVRGDAPARSPLLSTSSAKLPALDTLSQAAPSIDNLPLLLVGISEGAELLPDLAPVFSSVAGLVMVSAPGLDPVDAGRWQAQRLGQMDAWLQLESAQAATVSARPDGEWAQGRTLGYWRSFWTWPLAQRLIDGPWPLLRVHGGADEAVAPQAYAQFSLQAAQRTARWCDVVLPAAGHGLQSAQRDGVQWLWAQLEAWARQQGPHVCDTLVLP